MGRTNPKVIKAVKDFKRRISRRYKVKKIILFGSQAIGKAKKHSDVDIIVVSPIFKKNILRKAGKLHHEWHTKKIIIQSISFVIHQMNSTDCAKELLL